MLTGKELHIIAKLLDPATPEPESETCVRKLALSLRSRGASAEDFKHNGAPTPKLSRPDYGQCRFPWGPHAGEMFVDIDPAYLEEVVFWIEQGGAEQTGDNKQLAERIKKFLAQY